MQADFCPTRLNAVDIAQNWRNPVALRLTQTPFSNRFSHVGTWVHVVLIWASAGFVVRVFDSPKA